MGATINTHIEYKTADGRWLHWAAPHVRRDYRLFSLIAGVRNESNGIRPLVPCRGLPKDTSEATMFAYEQDALVDSLHHETWLNVDEFINLQLKLDELNASRPSLESDFEETVFRCYGPGGSALAAHKGFEDMRVIFWFWD